jgi:hypothetical protein
MDVTVTLPRSLADCDLTPALRRKLNLHPGLCPQFGTEWCALECPLACAVPQECPGAGECRDCPTGVRRRCPCGPAACGRNLTVSHSVQQEAA